MRHLFALSLSLLPLACQSKTPEPQAEERPAVEQPVESAKPAAPAAGEKQATSLASSSAMSASSASSSPRRPFPAPGMDDPLLGKFSLDDAVKGLTGKGSLVAEITTGLGKLECKLYDDKAPVTVANFIGLARGLRPFKTPQGEWVKKNAYDGTTFHRVIKGFMIQGGDPAGNGSGEPGYVIPDELWPGATHDRRGLMCMANRGPNTNGMQFFITDAAAPHLDRSYTIFGECGPDAVIEKLSSVEVRGDRAVDPTKIEKVTIKRKAISAAKPAGSVKPAK